jgi:hypothetical protein
MVHRRRRKTKVQRVVIFIKSIIAFFFSHVGLCAVVIGYALLGAVTFKAIESEHEHNVQRRVYDHRYQRVNVVRSHAHPPHVCHPEYPPHIA